MDDTVVDRKDLKHLEHQIEDRRERELRTEIRTIRADRDVLRDKSEKAHRRIAKLEDDVKALRQTCATKDEAMDLVWNENKAMRQQWTEVEWSERTGHKMATINGDIDWDALHDAWKVSEVRRVDTEEAREDEIWERQQAITQRD